MNKNRKAKKAGQKSYSPDFVHPAPGQASPEFPSRAITLLTDFGLADAYVGVMKGVVASINPRALVIDICHDVAPQDIREAAFLLASSFGYFPPGAIHVAVVDPTVGGERRAICAQAGGRFFVGPDNGVLSIACYRAGRPKIYLLENESFFLSPRSRTFDGRDVFAPVAARLSAGVPIEKMGRRARSMERIHLPRPAAGKGPALRGEVIHIDRFGNLITNIGPDIIHRTFLGTEPGGLVIACAGHEIAGLSETYADARSGVALALIGSHNFMEIALRDGAASSSLGVERGERVKITKGGL
jgi:S-adenosylmethionine hydrolase